MLPDIKNLKTTSSYTELFDAIHQGVPSVAFGVQDAYKCFLIANFNSPVLYIVKDMLSAREVKRTLTAYGKKAYILPPKEEMIYSMVAFSKDDTYERILTLSHLDDAQVIIAPIESVMQMQTVSAEVVCFEKGKEYDLTAITRKFVDMGYTRCELVSSKGTFSVRGDIVDVYSVDGESLIRLDFFGDTLDAIKLVDENSRKVIKEIDEVTVLQAQEFKFDFADAQKLRSVVSGEMKTSSKDAYVSNKTALDDVMADAESGSFNRLIPYVGVLGKAKSIFELVRKDTVVVIDEGKILSEKAGLVQAEYFARLNYAIKEGGVFSVATQSFIEFEKLKELSSGFRVVGLQSILSENGFFTALKTIKAQVVGVPDYKFSTSALFSDIRSYRANGYTVLVCAPDKRSMENFCCDLALQKIPYHIVKDGESELAPLSITISSLPKGFCCHQSKTVVIGAENLFAKPRDEKRGKLKSQSFFSAPEAGDYCVHEKFGVGRVIGNKKISTTESTKDYVAVEYKDGDLLYVPVEQMEVLTRYVGAEKNPKLSKLGSQDFTRVRERVEKSIKKMSFDLKKLYKERAESKGYAFTDFEDLQSAFDSAFEHEDTPDQKRTADEIKADMLKGRVMDRLVCGDVGFGKTEVAFRAIFRAITNGKQTALLAPTTILAEQHFNTAKKRFKDFAVRVECLNRLRTKKQQEKILKDLKDGKIDLIIGTHRLLSKDVAFKDLGLLVLDEEQRFGVEHKEKIKLVKKNVDTLTLTATPIPRTLHMSLSGIREISTINTPPKERLPVQVYVAEESETLLKDAISREVNRGGQAFILYNRVETIYDFAENIKRLLPNLKVAVAHGQMEEREMEKNVMDFYAGKSDCLVSTTIIENGIDLPKANTIIVINADALGLSTLYQLKGRVGRSDRLAYAYFTYKRDKVLTSNAYDRLSAIIEFTEMGSGMKVAMRDLEIRGAGNVLGAEQHGHMDKIGYELYSKLLREELTGEKEKSVELEVSVSAYIPESYIAKDSRRMDAYKAIAEIDGVSSAREIEKRLEEDYGRIPSQVRTLLSVAILKKLASKIGAEKVVINKKFKGIIFEDFSSFNNDKLLKAMDYSESYTKITAVGKPTIEFLDQSDDNEHVLFMMIDFLLQAVNG